MKYFFKKKEEEMFISKKSKECGIMLLLFSFVSRGYTYYYLTYHRLYTVFIQCVTLFINFWKIMKFWLSFTLFSVILLMGPKRF